MAVSLICMEPLGGRVLVERVVQVMRFVETWIKRAVLGAPANLKVKPPPARTCGALSWGAPLLDASYFLGAGLGVADRRAHERELVRGYYECLLELGVEGFAWEDCWEEYRRRLFGRNTRRASRHHDLDTG